MAPIKSQFSIFMFLEEARIEWSQRLAGSKPACCIARMKGRKLEDGETPEQVKRTGTDVSIRESKSLTKEKIQFLFSSCCSLEGTLGKWSFYASKGSEASSWMFTVSQLLGGPLACGIILPDAQ